MIHTDKVRSGDSNLISTHLGRTHELGGLPGWRRVRGHCSRALWLSRLVMENSGIGYPLTAFAYLSNMIETRCELRPRQRTLAAITLHAYVYWGLSFHFISSILLQHTALGTTASALEWKLMLAKWRHSGTLEPLR